MSGKIVLAAALGFISGAALGAILTYAISYSKIEAEQVERTNKEIEETRKEIKEYLLRKTGYSGEDYPMHDNAEVDCDSVDESPNKNGVNYTSFYRSTPRKVVKPGEKTAPVKVSGTASKTAAEPVFVDDWDSLVAITPKGDANIFEWNYYINFRGGLMVDCTTDEVVNFPVILTLSPAELNKIAREKKAEVLYIYLPADNIGVAIAVEQQVGPNLLEYELPPSLYPSPSEDDDEDEEEDDKELEEWLNERPDWGD